MLVLLIIFIAQNTDDVDVAFLGWQGRAPLAVTLLIALVGGLFLSGIAGMLRILQLRRGSGAASAAGGSGPTVAERDAGSRLARSPPQSR